MTCPESPDDYQTFHNVHEVEGSWVKLSWIKCYQLFSLLWYFKATISLFVVVVVCFCACLTLKKAEICICLKLTWHWGNCFGKFEHYYSNLFSCPSLVTAHQHYICCVTFFKMRRHILCTLTFPNNRTRLTDVCDRTPSVQFPGTRGQPWQKKIS